jgi:hypothetical protein
VKHIDFVSTLIKRNIYLKEGNVTSIMILVLPKKFVPPINYMQQQYQTQCRIKRGKEAKIDDIR